MTDQQNQDLEALRQSEERFANIFNNSPAPIVLTRVADGIAVDVNKAFCSLFGYTREEVIGHRSTDLRLIDPELRAEILEQLRSDGRIYNLETRTWNRAGHEITILLSVEMIHSSGDTYMLSTMLDVTEERRMTKKVQEQQAQLEAAYLGTVDALAQLIDIWDESTAGHSQRVANLTILLAQRFGFSDDDLGRIRVGALLHDIGKVGIPEHILHKPEKLTTEEMSIMQQHTEYAWTILSKIHYLGPSLDIPYCHHEKYDGTGYPRGLDDGKIPLCARIFAVVDVWDALTHDRAYRRAWDKPRALEYIQSQAGTLFDPQVVSVFTNLIEELERESRAN